MIGISINSSNLTQKIWKCSYNRLLSSPKHVCYPVINMLVSKQFLGYCCKTYPYFSFPPQSISCCFWEIKYQSVKVLIIYFLPLTNIPYVYNHNLFLATVPVLGFLVFSRGYKMGILVRNGLIYIFLLLSNKMPISCSRNQSPPPFQKMKQIHFQIAFSSLKN